MQLGGRSETYSMVSEKVGVHHVMTKTEGRLLSLIMGVFYFRTTILATVLVFFELGCFA